jgi:hypothetical protein
LNNSIKTDMIGGLIRLDEELCESGGIGRRAGFRFQWVTPVRVRVSPLAPNLISVK